MPGRSNPDLANRWWRDPRASALAAAGVALCVSGLVHVGVWGWTGGAWEGPVSWRKPILFGLSAGLTSLSLGWVWHALPTRRGDVPIARLTAVSLVLEVALIDLQCWRGVASHFNRATPLDSLLYDAMGGLILLVTAVVVDLSIRLLRGPSRFAAEMSLAARAGMVLLAVSCGIGIWTSVHGDLQVARGLPPDVYGAAGVPKFPHGAAIHALQWLPSLAWAARRAGLSEPRRLAVVIAATGASTLLLAFALGQTLAGRSRFDIPPAVAWSLVGAGLALLPLSLIVAGRCSGDPAGRA